MWGARKYFLVAGGLALALGLVLGLIFAGSGAQSLLFVAAGWVPLALIGSLGGALAVRYHGTVGVAFPLTLATCMLLRLIFGLAGVALASLNGMIAPYLTSLFATFAVMQVFETIWFFRRDRWSRAHEAPATR